MLSSHRSWNAHKDAIVSKASKSLLHKAKYASGKLKGEGSKLCAYCKTLVCPQIECTSLLWNPHQAYLIKKLESAQNKAAHFNAETTWTHQA